MGLAGSHTMEVQKGIIEAIGNTPLLKLWRVSEATVSVCGRLCCWHGRFRESD
jgi:hypothetical protein